MRSAYGDTKFYPFLERYFLTKFLKWSDEAEFEETKKENEWTFVIPSIGKMVTLTYNDNRVDETVRVCNLKDY